MCKGCCDQQMRFWVAIVQQLCLAVIMLGWSMRQVVLLIWSGKGAQLATRGQRLLSVLPRADAQQCASSHTLNCQYPHQRSVHNHMMQYTPLSNSPCGKSPTDPHEYKQLTDCTTKPYDANASKNAAVCLSHSITTQAPALNNTHITAHI